MDVQPTFIHHIFLVDIWEGTSDLPRLRTQFGIWNNNFLFDGAGALFDV